MAPLELPHLMDLTIGAVLGAAPGLLKDALAALRERRAIRAQLAFLLRELDQRLDAPRAAISEACDALRARLLDDHRANATQRQQNAVFEALQAAEALAALHSTHHTPERRRAALRAHRATHTQPSDSNRYSTTR